MPEQISIRVFLIRRLGVELQVVLRSTGLVKIEPYQCKDENLRTWTVIAETQTILAKTQLRANKDEDYAFILHSLFLRSGWEIMELEERKEYSL